MPGQEMRNLYPNDPNVMGRNRFDPPRGIQVSAGLPTAEETGGDIDLIGIISRMLEGEDTTEPVLSPGDLGNQIASVASTGGILDAIPQDVGEGRDFPAETPLLPTRPKPDIAAQTQPTQPDTAVMDNVFDVPIPSDKAMDKLAPVAAPNVALTSGSPPGDPLDFDPVASLLEQIDAANAPDTAPAPDSDSRRRSARTAPRPGGRSASVMANVAPDILADAATSGQRGNFPGGDFMFQELLKQLLSGRRTTPQALHRLRAEQRGY
jgi:hypothetical protein